MEQWREDRVKRLVLLVTLLLALSAPPALAVNDPFTPGEECAAENSQAVGHPAFGHQRPQGANPPFSANNPGNSTGARGEASSRAEAHCRNA